EAARRAFDREHPRHGGPADALALDGQRSPGCARKPRDAGHRRGLGAEATLEQEAQEPALVTRRDALAAQEPRRLLERRASPSAAHAASAGWARSASRAIGGAARFRSRTSIASRATSAMFTQNGRLHGLPGPQMSPSTIECSAVEITQPARAM